MYLWTCPLDHDLVLWAQLQIDIMLTNYPNAFRCITYLKDHWTHKVTMWFVGNHNIPHAGQDTNAVVESLHSNMKWIFFFFQKIIYWTYNGLVDFISCWRCFYSQLIWCVVQVFRVCEKKKKKHCCLTYAKGFKHFWFQCLFMSWWGGHCICHIHQPHTQSMENSCSIIWVVTMQLPICRTRNYMQTCHEGIQNATP